MSRLSVLLLACAWALFPIAARAQFTNAATDAYLAAKARDQGLTRVLVVLDVDVSLADIRSGTKRSAIEQRKQQVLAGMAHDEHVSEAAWESGLGQLSLLVNEAGLKRLRALPGVREVQVDMAEAQRLAVYDGDERVTAILRELVRSGTAAVRIYYVDGRVIERTIDLRKFHLLKETQEVKALVLAQNSLKGSTQIDPRIMQEAAKGDQLALNIALRVPEHFSPMRRKLPDKTWTAQVGEFDAIATRFAQEHALPNVPSLRGMPGFSVVVASEQARKLVADLTASPDPQVYSVTLADLLQPMVGQSTVYIGMPNAWNAGYEATGQSVIVLDTGTDGNHSFLQGDVIYEGCFGTNLNDSLGNPLWRGDCLQENILYDSPFPTAGSGIPCTSAPLDCRHGTHVSGIATGRYGTTRGQPAHGVARAAGLVPIRVFSRSVPSGVVGAFSTDILDAMIALTNTVPSDAFTVNMSVGSDFRVLSTCVDVVMAYTVDYLRDTWRIATVAAVGNDGMFGFAWPACAGSIVKVMSMCSIDDPQGSRCTVGQMSDFTNYAYPEAFGGPTFVAPGNSIYSSVPGGNYVLNNGTSMASPHVAGLYAAVKAALPGISVAGVTSWIQGNAVNMTHPNLPDATYKRIRVP